jgi:hypothetical protein
MMDRLKNHDRYAGKIMRSKIYNQGGSFTQSDLLCKLHLTSVQVQMVLDAMVDDGMLMEVTRVQGNGPKSRAYTRRSVSTVLSGRRLAYYSPPTPEKIRHYNDWIKTIAAYELGNVG